MIAEALLVVSNVLALIILVVLIGVTKALVEVLEDLRYAKTDDQNQREKPNSQIKTKENAVVENPFLNEKGLYSYDAYETKMKEKYDRPKNVIEV